MNPDIEPNPVQSPLFWICIAINTINFLYLCLVLIAYGFCLKPKYTKKIKEEDRRTIPGNQMLSREEDNFISRDY